MLVWPDDTDRSDLVHQIYDTALDNSLWPDMILRVFDVIEKTEADPALTEDLLDLQRHFARALALSEKIIALENSVDLKGRLLGHLGISVTILGEQGDVISHDDPTAARLCLQRPDLLPETDVLESMIDECRQNEGPVMRAVPDGAMPTLILFARAQILSRALPEDITWVLVFVDKTANQLADHFGQRFALTPAVPCQSLSVSSGTASKRSATRP